eukprot:gene20297-22283_t
MTLFSGITRRFFRFPWNNRLPARFSSRDLSTKNYDVAIVGGGIVGLAAAQELILRYPDLQFVVLEKEDNLAFHQTGHNSGVIHAGIYYKPGTLKAKLCVEGLNLTYKYCDEYNVPYKKCGKLIVAVTDEEVPRLEDLYKRGIVNGVKGLEFLNKSQIKELEPYCEGKIALLSPHTGIVDWAQVARTFGKVFENKGGTIITGYGVDGFHPNLEQGDKEANSTNYPIRIHSTKNQSINCKYVLTCGGLYSDRLAVNSGCSNEPKIVPFRGEYLVLKEEKQHMIKGNIYPVPDPNLPFLGVHFTPRMDGKIWLGPNAVLAFQREGYKITDFNFNDLIESLTSRGLQKLIWKHWKFGAEEFYRSLDLRAQVKLLQKYIPDIHAEDVLRGPSGVRAQAIDKDGNLVDDFVFDVGKSSMTNRILHVRNAPSPAATSSLAIAKMIADKCQQEFHL